MGQPQPNYKNPGPNAYLQNKGLEHVTKSQPSVVFTKVPKRHDPARYASGMEEFTEKGLVVEWGGEGNR